MKSTNLERDARVGGVGSIGADSAELILIDDLVLEHDERGGALALHAALAGDGNLRRRTSIGVERADERDKLRVAGAQRRDRYKNKKND